MIVMQAELFQWRKKHAHGYYSLEDLDQYDSEIARDLMFIHDRISMNPMRSGMTPTYGSDWESQKIMDYTLGQIKSSLLPAVQEGLNRVRPKARKQVQDLVAKAVRHMSLAEGFKRQRKITEAGKDTEAAFMHLHEAIELIAQDTRRVPKGRSLMQ